MVFRPYFAFGYLHSSPLRRGWHLLALSLTLAAAATAWADVINLRKGRQIVAHVTRQDARRVYFERCGVESSLAWSEIERIDSLSNPANEPAPGSGSGGPGCEQVHALELHPQILAPVVKDNALDEAYLARPDAQVEPTLLLPTVACWHRSTRRPRIFWRTRGTPVRPSRESATPCG